MACEQSAAVVGHDHSFYDCGVSPFCFAWVLYVFLLLCLVELVYVVDDDEISRFDGSF